MPSQSEMERKFEDLKTYLDDSKRSIVKLHAQGGNSILFTYPPREEMKYLLELHKRYPEADYIDLSKLFVQYIDAPGIDSFINLYLEHDYDPENIFISEEEGIDDFYTLVMKEIEEASKKSEYIFVIRTGILYGTGMTDSKFLESELVSRLKKPIVVMYPSSLDRSNESNPKLLFLGFAPASIYRSFPIY